MNDRPACVRQSHTFHMLCAAGQVGVVGELEYRRAEPYAVTATFRVGSDAGVQWLFARDLLVEGVIGPAGDGDIHIAPDENDVETVIIELRSPDGSAVLAVRAQCLAEFLDATYAVVGVGEEHRTVDIDYELFTLLANDWL
ncbi:MAG TPA: SsgA family sporulation/cell division regulator [Pseudonocardiaceae bacterium]|nr:SsgA family sporulation/cell division regulator [Pseudonocardiaceae bacterium]